MHGFCLGIVCNGCSLDEPAYDPASSAASIVEERHHPHRPNFWLHSWRRFTANPPADRFSNCSLQTRCPSRPCLGTSTSFTHRQRWSWLSLCSTTSNVLELDHLIQVDQGKSGWFPFRMAKGALVTISLLKTSPLLRSPHWKVLMLLHILLVSILRRILWSFT